VAVSYPIPNWISQGADPAAQYAQGLGIGVRIGAERAAQQYQQQALLRAQAQDEFEKQYKTQVLNLQVDKAMRVQQAQAGFQQAVQSGMDPSQALMQFGPAMGDSAADIIQAQEMAEYRQQQLGETRDWRQSQEQRWNEDRASREEVSAENRASREALQTANRESRELLQGENRNLRATMALEKDEALKSLQQQLSDAKLDLEDIRSRQGKWFKGTSQEDIAAAEKAVADAQAGIEARRNELRREFGIGASPQAAAMPAAPGAPLTDQPASPAKTYRYDPITRRIVPR
jgi:hypothetical protein